MRSTGMYLLAALLTAATVPIYIYIYHRAIRPDIVTQLPRAVPVPGVTYADRAHDHDRPTVLSPNEYRAMEALGSGRAKCVAGVVYRTSDHVIEPWPGHVRCTSYGSGAYVGVLGGGV